MSITHNLKNLSEEQSKHLALGKSIVDNMNNVVDDKNTFSYNGFKFSPVVFGHEQTIVYRILSFISNNSFDSSVDYVIEHITDSLKKFGSTDVELKNRKKYLSKIIPFLKNYPTNYLSQEPRTRLHSFIKILGV